MLASAWHRRNLTPSLHAPPTPLPLSGGEKEQRGREMGMERNPLFIGLLLVLFFGVAVYMRLWAIDFSLSKEDNDLIRKQFDLAHREAMEESAEWRLRYDEEMERGTQRLRELIQLKESLEQKVEETASINNKLTILQKENSDLHNQVDSLTKELETLKSRYNASNTN